MGVFDTREEAVRRLITRPVELRNQCSDVYRSYDFDAIAGKVIGLIDFGPLGKAWGVRLSVSDDEFYQAFEDHKLSEV